MCAWFRQPRKRLCTARLADVLSIDKPPQPPLFDVADNAADDFLVLQPLHKAEHGTVLGLPDGQPPCGGLLPAKGRDECIVPPPGLAVEPPYVKRTQRRRGTSTQGMPRLRRRTVRSGGESAFGTHRAHHDLVGERTVPRTVVRRIERPRQLPRERRGGLRPDNGSIAKAPFLVPAPDAHHVLRIPCDGPGVAVGGGRPRLPGEPGGPHIRDVSERGRAPLLAGEDFSDKAARPLGENPRTRPPLLLLDFALERARRQMDAPSGEAAIGPHKLHERDVDVPDRHAEAEARVRRLHAPAAERAQGRAEVAHANPFEQLDEREVEREDERVGRRHRAAVGRVEVLGIVAAIGARHVRQTLLGRHETEVQRTRRQKGLERRPRRTRRAGDVDLSGVRREVVARTREGQDLPRLHAHHDRRRRMSAGGRRLHHALRPRLDVRIERRAEVAPRTAPARHMPHRPVAEERLGERTRTALDAGEYLPRPFVLPRVDHPARPHPPQHVFAPLQRPFEVAVRTKPRRPLHHAREERRLPDPQVVRPLAEPPVRGGLDPHQIRAERRTVQVLRDDPELVVPPFDLERAKRLDVLPGERARMRHHEARRLHRDRGGAGDPPQMRDVLHARPQDTRHVDAPVAEETTVLARDERLHDPVVRGGDVVGTAVDVARSQRHAQHAPRAVAQDRAAWIDLRRVEARVDREPRDGEDKRPRREETAPRDGGAPQRTLAAPRHGATVIRPAAPRARRAGAYIASTDGPGRMNVPALTTRTA